MPSPLGGDTAADSVASDHQPAPKTQDILDLETPGMVASKDDPNAQINAPDLTLDVLPGETVAQAKADRARETSIRPPEPMSVEQLRQSLLPSAALPATPSDGITNTASSIPPPAPAYSPETDPSAPVPVSRQPVINPVHAPIANPFDILNR